MGGTSQATIEQKLSAVQDWEKNGWNTVEAESKLGIPRSTLRGWRTQFDANKFAETNLLAKRVSRPGKAPPTVDYEPPLVDMIRSDSVKMSRSDVIDYCMDKIPGFKDRAYKARRSWLDRFIARHDLSEHLTRYQRGESRKATIETRESKPPAKKLKIGEATTQNDSMDLAAPKFDSSEIIDLIDLLEADDDDEDTLIPPQGDDEGSKSVRDTQAVCFQHSASHYRLVLTKNDLETLEPETWLNDVVISFFIREHIPAYGPTFNFDAQLFATLLQAFNASKSIEGMYRATRGITASFLYEKYKYVMVPICMHGHWSFVILQNPVTAFDNVNRYFFHVDSLLMHDTKIVHKILGGYFNAEQDMKFPAKPATKFIVQTYQTSPRQTNGFDCGVFVLYFMKKVNEVLHRDENVYLIQDMKTLVKVPRKLRFDSGRYRAEIKSLLSSSE